MISVLLLLWSVNLNGAFNDFPALISSNATMAVVIGNTYFVSKKDYRSTVSVIYELLTGIIQSEMRVGGIIVHIFSDTNVNLRRDYTALLSIATCQETWTLYRKARKEELIHLAITDENLLIDRDCPRIPSSNGISIPLMQPGEELPQIFFDLRVHDDLSWSNVNVLHSDAFDRDTIGKVVRALCDQLPNKRLDIPSRTVFSFKHSDVARNRKQHIKEILAKNNDHQPRHCFLIIVTLDVLADVMEVVRSLKMVDPISQWLYVIPESGTQNSTNISSYADLLTEGGNIAFLYNTTDFHGVCNAGLQCHVKEVVRALAKALQNSLINEMELFERLGKNEFEVIRLNKAERREEILKSMRTELSEDRAAEGGNCGKCISWRFSSAITWGTFFNEGTGHIIDTGSWSPSLAVNLTDVIFPHVTHGFRGITLPIVTYHNPPWQTIATTDSGKRIYGGLVFDVINYFSKKLNFTYIVETLTTNNKSSNYSESLGIDQVNTDELFTSTTRKIPEEVVNMVRNRKVFMAACAYTVNEYGKINVNFTTPIFVQTYSFLSARPKQLSRVLLFTSPFRKETWACLASAIIIMGPILYLVHKYSPRSMKTSGLSSSWQCIWYVYGALLQQGGMYLPQSDSARLIIGVWWLIVMVLVATYSGSLVAFLTFPRMDEPLLTLDDLLARSDTLTWGFLNGSFLEEYLRYSEDVKYQEFLSRAERHNSTDIQNVVKRIVQGKHVFIDWGSSLRFLMRKDFLSTGGCHFSLSTEEFMEEPIAMIVAKDSPYLPIINAELHRMKESGLLNKWISAKMPMKDRCWTIINNNQIVDKRKVNVADMQGIFFVLFMGVVSSLILLLAELYWHRRKVNKERRLIRPFVS